MKDYPRIDDQCLPGNRVRLTENYNLPRYILGISCALQRCPFLERGNSRWRNTGEHPCALHQTRGDAVDGDRGRKCYRQASGEMDEACL